MGKKTVLFCSGLSGSGKSFFIKYVLPSGAFYNLRSATTRAKRDGEADGREYYFRDEEYFDREKFVTKLFVNEQFWKPGMPKWLYGVPEFEVLNHWGENFTYDVIQPRYIRQMQDWFKNHDNAGLYDFRILWFQPPENATDIAKSRQNMPNDMDVRRANTCNAEDFTAAGLTPDHRVVCNPLELSFDPRLHAFLDSLRTR